MGTPKPQTVRVNLHFVPDGRVMAAIMTQEWRGPVRLDRRHTSAWPLADVRPCPPGCDSRLWYAFEALGEYLRRQSLEHALKVLTE